jgi:hypothetical protein
VAWFLPWFALVMAQAQQGKETGDRHTWWFAFASVLFVHSDSGEGGSSGRMPEFMNYLADEKGEM